MIKHNFKHFEELESTNTYAMHNILTLNNMDIIVASKQTGGRGRFQRKWVSDKENNIYMSIVLKPCPELNNNMPIVNLPQYMSVVICKILTNYGVNAEIKWPNDVLVNGKKIAGILCETSIRGSQLNGIVLGVGINLNLEEKDIENIDKPATALNLLLDKQIDKKMFTDKLILEFVENYEMFLKNGFQFIKQEYIEKCCFLGQSIQITNPNSIKTALAKEINNNGELVILEKNKKETTINAGDISYTKMS